VDGNSKYPVFIIIIIIIIIINIDDDEIWCLSQQLVPFVRVCCRLQSSSASVGYSCK